MCSRAAIAATIAVTLAAWPGSARPQAYVDDKNPTGLPDLSQDTRAVCEAAAVADVLWEIGEHSPFDGDGKAERRLVAHPDSNDKDKPQQWPKTFGQWAKDGQKLVDDLALFIYGEVTLPTGKKAILRTAYGPGAGTQRYLLSRRHLFLPPTRNDPTGNPKGLSVKTLNPPREGSYARLYQELLTKDGTISPSTRVVTHWVWLNDKETRLNYEDSTTTARHALAVAALAPRKNDGSPNTSEIFVTNGWEPAQKGRKSPYPNTKDADGNPLKTPVERAGKDPVSRDFYDRYTDLEVNPAGFLRIPSSANNDFLVKRLKDAVRTMMYQMLVIKPGGSPRVELEVQPAGVRNRFTYRVFNPDPSEQHHVFIEVDPLALATLAEDDVDAPPGWEVELWDPGGPIASPFEDEPADGQDLFGPPINDPEVDTPITWDPDWGGLHWYWRGPEGGPIETSETLEFAFEIDAAVPYSTAPVNTAVVGEEAHGVHHYSLVGGPYACVFHPRSSSYRDLVLADRDGDGLCEFPEAKTDFPGTITIGTRTSVEFTGTTILEADRIVIDEAGQAVGEAALLRALTLVGKTGGVVSRGTVHLAASDDLSVSAWYGDVDLRGRLELGAADRLLLDARRGNLVLAPSEPGAPGSFTAIGRNRADLQARGANGSLRIEGARVGARRLALSTRANVSVVGTKELSVASDSELTTDLDDLAVTSGSASDLRIDATGDVRIGRATLDAGRNVRVQTARAADDLCLADRTTIEARDRAGRSTFIDLRNVRGRVLDDGSTMTMGTVLGAIEPGVCP